MSRSTLLAISIVAHVGLVAALARIERPVAHAATAITMSETRKKPPPPKPVDEPPPPEEKPPPHRNAERAKVAPVAAQADVPPPPASNDSAAAGGFDALPDFGFSLSGGTGSGGLAVGAGGPRGERRSPVEKVVKRAQTLAPKLDACDEPLVKPKPKLVPTPSYSEAGRSAGVEGKVRIEVTVDEQGRVVSVRLLQGLGHGLDEAALDAAHRATFEPATRCGKPASATFNIGMRFSL